MEILLLEDLAPDARQWLEERHHVDYQPQLAHDPGALRGQLYKTEALVVPPQLKVNSQLLDFAPRLAVIGRLHDDEENIDFHACQRRRIRVVQATNAAVRANAEFQLGALLSLLRPGLMRDSVPRPGREINDSVIALFGMAPTAHLLATMLVPLGARVVGYDPAVHRTAELWQRLGVQPLGLADMLEVADAVAVQMIYASRYKGMVGERVLAACKPGQLWTSISRPELFQWPALADALRTGRMGACVMDSDDARLRAPESLLRGVPNLHLTPRLAPSTQEARLRGSWYVADRIHETLLLTESQRGMLDSAPMPPQYA